MNDWSIYRGGFISSSCSHPIQPDSENAEKDHDCSSGFYRVISTWDIWIGNSKNVFSCNFINWLCSLYCAQTKWQPSLMSPITLWKAVLETRVYRILPSWAYGTRSDHIWIRGRGWRRSKGWATINGSRLETGLFGASAQQISVALYVKSVSYWLHLPANISCWAKTIDVKIYIHCLT